MRALSNAVNSLIPKPDNDLTWKSQRELLKQLPASRDKPTQQAVDVREAVSACIPEHLRIVQPEIRGADREVYCVEYSEDALDYMIGREKKFRLPNDFLSGNKISPRNRQIVINWMVQVHQQFEMLPTTLWHAISLLDAYINKNIIDKSKLQLMAIATMQIASKYEELYPTETLKFINLMDNVTADALHAMERDVLRSLNCDLSKPTPYDILQRLVAITNLSTLVKRRAEFFTEIAIGAYTSSSWLPSENALISLTLAARLEEPSWLSQILLRKVGIKCTMLFDALKILAKAVLDIETENRLMGVHNKYSSSYFLRVSKLNEQQKQFLKNVAGI